MLAKSQFKLHLYNVLVLKGLEMQLFNNDVPHRKLTSNTMKRDCGFWETGNFQVEKVHISKTEKEKAFKPLEFQSLFFFFFTNLKTTLLIKVTYIYSFII